MNKAVISIILIVVVIVGGYLLWAGSQRQSELPEVVLPSKLETNPGKEAAVPGEEAMMSEVKEIAVSGTEFSFNPGSITLVEGEKVRIVFTNAGSAPHDFVIEGLNIRTKVIGPGQEDAVEFMSPSTGTYTFFCSVAGHRQAGMEGGLTIK